MKQKPKRVSIFASIGCQNIGDELILKNEIKLLKQEFGYDTKFYIFTYSKEDVLYSGLECDYREYFPIGIKNPKNIFKNISSFFAFLSAVQESDYVVIGGGGLIYDTENQSTKSPLDLWVFRTKWFRRFRKKIYFYRIGVDVKQEENLGKLTKIFKKSWKITVRDEVSKQILEHVGIKNIEVQEDPVFFDNGILPQESMCLKKIQSTKFQVPDLQGIDFSGKSVGIALRSGYLAPKGTMQARMEEGKMRELVRFLQKQGAKIIFIPHSFHATDEKANDKTFLEQFIVDGVEIKSDMQSVYDVYKKSEIDVCISMRLHSMVLCEVYEIPYVGLSYSLKTENVMKTVFEKKEV